MFKLVLISIVVMPVLLAMRAARLRTRPRGLLVLLAAVLGYQAFYMLTLYYLRVRWLGW
jgi:hypothetical protein